MVRHAGPILVDTNIVIECWRTGGWRALTGAYPIETVEDCVTETQTGNQQRRKEQVIDGAELRRSLAAVHQVTKVQMAQALVLEGSLAYLDPGERALWAHAIGRSDAWLLCGPDVASMRLGVRLGFGRRLAALEALLDEIGFRPKIALRQNYTAKWHRMKLAELIASEGGSR